MNAPGHEKRAAPTSGFTLLEMLVAVAILAVLVSIIPRSFVYARAIINRSEAWTEARLVAESVLNGELAGKGLQPGMRRGSLDGRAWVATLKRSRNLPAATESDRVLLEVKLRVTVSPQQTLDVETLRIGAAQ